MQSDLWALTIDVETHWGLSITFFAPTKSSPALRVVPPTTIIGALAYPLARLKGWSENLSAKTSGADRLRSILEGVYYSVLSGSMVPHAEVTKIVSYKVREKRVISDAAAVQKTYTEPGTTLRLYYIFDTERAKGLLGGSWRSLLAEAAWGISRLGSKESLVSVVRVEEVGVEPVEMNRVETAATIPLDHVEELGGSYILARVVDWRSTGIGSYYGAPMVMVAQPLGPLGQPPQEGVKARLRHPRAYRVGDEYLVPWTSRG